MTDWVWVALGYGIAYGAIATYFAVLGRRWAALRRKGAGR
jgi:hypothetical protein